MFSKFVESYLFQQVCTIIFALESAAMSGRYVWQWRKTNHIWVDMDETTCDELDEYYLLGDNPIVTVHVEAQYGQNRGSRRPMTVDFHNMTQTIDVQRPIRRIEILHDLTGHVEIIPGRSNSPHKRQRR